MEIVSTGRREIKVCGDGNCFYRAIARAVDGKTDEAHLTFRDMCNEMIAEYPDVFEPYLFNTKSVEEHVRKSVKAGTWAETGRLFSGGALRFPLYSPYPFKNVGILLSDNQS